MKAWILQSSGAHLLGYVILFPSELPKGINSCYQPCEECEKSGQTCFWSEHIKCDRCFEENLNCSSLSWLCIRILADLFRLDQSASQALFQSYKAGKLLTYAESPPNLQEAWKLLDQERASRQALELQVSSLQKELEDNQRELSLTRKLLLEQVEKAQDNEMSRQDLENIVAIKLQALEETLQNGLENRLRKEALVTLIPTVADDLNQWASESND